MQRFWDKVDKTGDCWEWTSAKDTNGYGRFTLNGKTVSAHRLSYELMIGEIPKGSGFHGACICHKCDNPSCVNPDHFFIGTHKENMSDSRKKGRATGARGSAHSRAKLHELDIPRIKDMLRMKVLQREIADWFGVGIKAISDINTGTTWKHVT